ncbi:MAG: T9SS type A sorting domain-containing protein [Bacteroidia bacterium]|jgi:hypothetical protein|nr:T9SS type A sorting domain-containing protein [Bacteroidia bacterium]
MKQTLTTPLTRNLAKAYPFLAVLFLLFSSTTNTNAQCIGTRQQFGPFVAPEPGAPDVSWDNRTQFLANWSLVTLKAGNSYTFSGAYLIFNQSFLHANTELTLTDTNNNVLAFGTSPIRYVPTTNMVVRLHQFSQNGACGSTESGNGSNGHRFFISTAACVRITSNTGATCPEIANGSATIVVDSSSGANTFTWSPSGGTAATASGLAPGNYTCTITNACSTTIMLPVVIENLAPTAAITNTTDTVICVGQTATLQASLPGNPTITSYMWSNGDTNAAINAGIGNYTVVLKTPNGCSSKPSPVKQVVAKQLPTLAVQTVSNNLCFVERTTLSVDVTGINAPTYLWSNGSTLASPTVGPGKYSVVVTEAGGCKYNSDTLTIIEKLGKATIVTSDTQLCANQTKILGAFIPDNRFVSSVISSRGFVGNINDIIGSPNNSSSFLQTSSEVEMVLGFSNPIPINYVAVYEKGRFGMIDSVSIKNPNTNQWELVYSKKATLDFTQPLGITTRIVFPLTTYTVSEVKIHATLINFQTTLIDAVEIGRPIPATNYLWSTGSTSSIINAAVGSYAAILTDTSGCRFATDTLVLEEKIGVAQIISSAEPICAYDTKPLTAIAQEKQWAGSVISHNGLNPDAITGPINTQPWYGIASTGSPNHFIEVKFSQPMLINFINIYELGTFGTLDSVFVKNPNTNQWEPVYGRVRPSSINNNAPQNVVSHIEFPLTTFPVSEVRIQAYYISFYNIIIDAVEIGRDVPVANYKWSTNATTDTIFAMPGKYAVELRTVGTAGCRFVSDSTEVALKVLPEPIVNIQEISTINPIASIGGTATASDKYFNNDPEEAFDGDLVIKGWAGVNLPAQLNYDFGTGNAKTVTSYKLYCNPTQEGGWGNGYSPKRWRFEGYDGANWIVLDSQSLASFPDATWQTYTFTNANAYQKYRINIIENINEQTGSGAYVYITEMQLLTDAVFNNCDNKLFLATVDEQSLPANYQWKVDGKNVGANNDTLSLQNFAKSSSITCVVSRANACLPAPTTTSNAIILNTGTVMNVVDTAICSGQTFTYNAVTYNTTGVYTDTLLAASGCDSIVGLLLTVANPVIVTVNSGSICKGDTFEITPSGAFSYTIDGGGSFRVSPANTTIYFITGTDEFGCISQNPAASTVNVNVPSVLLISSADTILCRGEGTTLTANGSLNYTWSTGDTTRTISISPNSTRTYSVSGVDANGCKSVDSASKTVIVNALPTVSITAADTVVCIGQSTTLTAAGALNYTWSTGAATNPITISPTALTTYSVVGTDANGCAGTDTIAIDAIVCASIDEQTKGASLTFVLMPNPNNGTFTIDFPEFKKSATIQIFNLLGEEVYSEQMMSSSHLFTNHLSSGIYTVRLSSDKNTQTQKLVIQ